MRRIYDLRHAYAIVPELQRWLAENRGDLFRVEVTRSHLSAGASAVGAELLIPFLGTAGGTVVGLAIYDALLAFGSATSSARSRHAREALEAFRKKAVGFFAQARTFQVMGAQRRDVRPEAYVESKRVRDEARELLEAMAATVRDELAPADGQRHGERSHRRRWSRWSRWTFGG